MSEAWREQWRKDLCGECKRPFGEHTEADLDTCALTLNQLSERLGLPPLEDS